jgi:ABC-type antimicrobial peptide transport system permease subunit
MTTHYLKVAFRNMRKYKNQTLISVVEDQPFFYRKLDPRDMRESTVLFKYQEGMWKSCKEKIDRLMEKEYDGVNHAIINSEEEYEEFLKSEKALMKLLSFVSAICILICVFGFVSLVSLTCEERRKSIAIRKVNGATSGDILAMFAKEYFLLLVIGAAIAFTAGYFIMQRWLEQYVKQTSIPLWIYLSIMGVLALVIVLCVGWQVYKSSIENPADVVKSE